MNAKMLSKIAEVEDRVNTICKCLVVGEANHFTIEYSNSAVSITAYSHDESTNNLLRNLMRIHSKPEDAIEYKKFSNPDKTFWTTELTIPL